MRQLPNLLAVPTQKTFSSLSPNMDFNTGLSGKLKRKASCLTSSTSLPSTTMAFNDSQSIHSSLEKQTETFVNNQPINCDDFDNECGRGPLKNEEKRPRFSIIDLLSASTSSTQNSMTSPSEINTEVSASTSMTLEAKSPSITQSSSNNNVNSTPETNNKSEECLKLSKNGDYQQNGKLRGTTKKANWQSDTVIRKYSKSESIVVPANFIPNGNSTKLSNIRCSLETENQVLWTKFCKIGTEMIITKPGRRMFPTIKIRLENCDANSNYYVYLDAIPVDTKRYRYVYSKSAWCCSGKADRTPPNRLYMHPDSPFSGAQLSLHTVSFEKAKLTNNESDNRGHLVLNSMHKYQPRLHVLRRARNLPPLENGGQYVDLCAPNFRDEYKTFRFAETQFMAVTAYQNQLVTEMKIAMNPFAKGFRDHGNRSDSATEFMDSLSASSAPVNLCMPPISFPLESNSSKIAESCPKNQTLSAMKNTLMQQQQQHQKQQEQQNQHNYLINKSSFVQRCSHIAPYAQALSSLFPSYSRTSAVLNNGGANLLKPVDHSSLPSSSSSTFPTKVIPSWQEYFLQHCQFLQQQQKIHRQQQLTQSYLQACNLERLGRSTNNATDVEEYSLTNTIINSENNDNFTPEICQIDATNNTVIEGLAEKHENEETIISESQQNLTNYIAEDLQINENKNEEVIQIKSVTASPVPSTTTSTNTQSNRDKMNEFIKVGSIDGYTEAQSKSAKVLKKKHAKLLKRRKRMAVLKSSD